MRAAHKIVPLNGHYIWTAARGAAADTEACAGCHAGSRSWRSCGLRAMVAQASYRASSECHYRAGMLRHHRVSLGMQGKGAGQAHSHQGHSGYY